MGEGFNWFLIIIVVVVVALVLISNAYIIVYLQHPDDRNQAWIPKLVVWLGLSLATITVLMFPLDVANRGACAEDIPLSSCDLTLPMRHLWFAVYILNTATVYFLAPFSVFYYEAGIDKTIGQRVISALVWVSATGVILGLILGIAYALAGYVEYPTEKLSSGVMSLEDFWTFDSLAECLSINSTSSSLEFEGNLCNAKKTLLVDETWKLRTSFPLYIVALSSAAGWLTFLIFGGIGLSALPIDLIRSFLFRPKSTITRMEYINQARFLAQHAREIKSLGEELKREERESGRSRKWRKNLKELNKQLVILEEMNQDLDSKYPQGEDGETRWILFQLSFYLKLCLGILGLAVSIVWIVHIVLYQLFSPPVTSFLNNVFVDLDDIFPLFGTAAFAFFCLYLIGCTIKGHMKLGMSFGILDLYPIRPSGTLMNSLLFNTALILLSSTAVVQFCSEAFAVYAKDTDIQEIFGNEIQHLIGIKYLYKKDIFLYALLGFSALGIVLLFSNRCRDNNKRSSRGDVYVS